MERFKKRSECRILLHHRRSGRSAAGSGRLLSGRRRRRRSRSSRRRQHLDGDSARRGCCTVSCRKRWSSSAISSERGIRENYKTLSDASLCVLISPFFSFLHAEDVLRRPTMPLPPSTSASTPSLATLPLPQPLPHLPLGPGVHLPHSPLPLSSTPSVKKLPPSSPNTDSTFPFSPRTSSPPPLPARPPLPSPLHPQRARRSNTSSQRAMRF
jgi:hypothetical protein